MTGAVREHDSYPLALTVHYERNKDGGSPHGFAVVCLGGFVVHKEPLHPGSAGDVDRCDLEEAVAGWLEKDTCEAGAR